MTTNGFAAAWRASSPVPFAAACLTLSIALAGCESGTSILNGANQPAVAVAPAPTNSRIATVAIAPVLGVPEATSKQMAAQIAAGLDKSRFSVAATPSAPADYTLRGYATAAKEKSGAKLSYFFDVIDKGGTKVNRIAGEEPLPNAPAGKEVWQAVTPAISQAVATKTITSFSAYVPLSPSAAGAGPAIASAPVKSAPASGAGAATSTAAVANATGDLANSAIATASVGPARTSGPATGSIDKAAVAAIVPSVTGAPGDGSQSLSAALQKELSRSGVAMADASGAAAAYKVEGKVAVGPDKDGKQPIQIDWIVKDPQGKKLGTVSQKNDIPQGSLDGAWGKTADAAAAAAAQGIIKLIPGAKTTQ